MYTVDYFINKFEAIPEEQWCVGTTEDDNGRHCAWGHIVRPKCRIADYLNESRALMILLRDAGLDDCGDPSSINNGWHDSYRQPTPKQRILAALYDIKAMQEPKDTGGKKERIVYVSVPVSITEQSKDLVLS